jgi:hypothetical protein
VADFPQIGADEFGFHISWNEFNVASGTPLFIDAAILSVSKAALVAAASAPAAFQFTIPFTTGYEFALQPAFTPPGASNFLGNGGLEYFVSTVVSSGGNHVMLWAVTNTSSLATTQPAPTLLRIAAPITTLNYTFPDVANQRPGPLPYGSTFIPPEPPAFLDGGDARVLSLSYAGGRLYMTLQTAVMDQNGRFVVGGAYVVLSPTLRSGNLAATVLNQGYLFLNNNHLLRPAIAVNPQGKGAITVTLAGPDWYPSAAFIPFDTVSIPSTLAIAALGTSPEDGFTGYPGGGFTGVARWGDYNGATVSTDGAIWMVVEYIGDFPRTDAANWNTYVIRRLP